jgi:thioesterase domain-containing protein/acyl carrier protein
VKVRGFRIELGEVEAALSSHAGVGECVVVARAEAEGEKRLVAYVVGVSGAAATGEGEAVKVSELRSYLQSRLPDYMVPSVFVELAELPLTANGKVDRKALPASDFIERDESKAFVSPRDLLELQLTRMWEEVLGVREVSIRDSFFDLGGHSLLAVRLLTRVTELTGRRLPLATLFKEKTIEQLAATLRRQGEVAHPPSPLVPLQERGSRPPLFCVHPVGGNVFCYTPLSRQLGSQQPLYAFQSIGLNGEDVQHTSIEEMASMYLALMSEVQSEGPYHLAGWSMGGVVAFEMARQLRVRGHEVALVALFDSRLAPFGSQAEIENEVALLHSFARDLELKIDWTALSAGELAHMTSDDQLMHLLEQARRVNLLPPDMTDSEARRLYQVFKNNARAIQRYVPRPYDGQIILFEASERLPGGAQLPYGWDAVATGPLQVYDVPGDHYSMVREPHVEALAALLSACLEASQQELSARARVRQPERAV